MSRDEAEGLNALYRDVLTSDLPDPELLARYVTAPNELSEAERLEVEEAMRRSPAVVDELDTLRGFDFSQLDADRRAAAERSGLFAALAAWLSPGRLAAVAAVVAVLALSIRVLQQPDAGGTREPARVAQETAPEAPRGRAPAPRAPTPGPLAPDEAESTRLAQQPTPGAEPAAPTGPTASPPATGVDPAPDPPDETRLAEERAPVPPPRPPERDDAEPPTSPAQPGPTRATPPDEVLLAMNVPRYATPLDAATRAFDAPYRAGGGAPAITLLAPAHVARSATPQPTLHWHVDRVPGDGGFYLTVSDERDEDVVENRALAAVLRPGIQRVSLAELGVSLAPGVEYRWSIALRPDAEAPPERFAFGWLRVVPPEDAARASFAAAPAVERPDRFARAGYWYDAVDATVGLVEAHPTDARPAAALSALLEQGGVELDLDID